MTPEPITETAVQRELLRLALHNSGRSVLILTMAVAVIVAMGFGVGCYGAATVTGALGVVVATWRWLISRRYANTYVLSEHALRHPQRELEGNAALAGLMNVLTLPDRSRVSTRLGFFIAAAVIAVTGWTLYDATLKASAASRSVSHRASAPDLQRHCQQPGVVAEGSRRSLQLGCAQAQWYLIARPMEGAAFQDWVRDWKQPR